MGTVEQRNCQKAGLGEFFRRIAVVSSGQNGGVPQKRKEDSLESKIEASFRRAEMRCNSALDDWNENFSMIPTAEEADARTFSHMESMFLDGFHPEEIIRALQVHSPYTMGIHQEHLRRLFRSMLMRKFSIPDITDIAWHPAYPFYATGKRSGDGTMEVNSGFFDTVSLSYDIKNHRVIICGTDFEGQSLQQYLLATAYLFHWENLLADIP